MIGPRLVDKPLVLYGYGKLGHLAEEIFNELKIPILYILDQKKGSIPPFPKGDFSKCVEIPTTHLLAICVATESYEKITTSLRHAGWTDIVPVYDIIEAYPETGIHNGWFAGELTDEDRDNISYVADKWKGDQYSWWYYWMFQEWRINHNEYALHWEAEDGRGRISSLPSTLADIRRRQKAIVWSGGTYHPPITIHTEGKELDTLSLNIKWLQKNRPTLSVACYHSRDGLWKIEKFLMDNLLDYKWTFRLHAYCGQAAVMYGTPKEKI